GYNSVSQVDNHASPATTTSMTTPSSCQISNPIGGHSMERLQPSIPKGTSSMLTTGTANRLATGATHANRPKLISTRPDTKGDNSSWVRNRTFTGPILPAG